MSIVSAVTRTRSPTLPSAPRQPGASADAVGGGRAAPRTKSQHVTTTIRPSAPDIVDHPLGHQESASFGWPYPGRIVVILAGASPDLLDLSVMPQGGFRCPVACHHRLPSFGLAPAG
jgi:hypothetical protein